MRSLKPEFLNALDNFIAARSHADKMENWFLRRRIVVELEWQANSNYCDAGQLVLFPIQTNPPYSQAVIAMRLKSAESCTPSSPNWMTTQERGGAAAATTMDFQSANSIIESEHFGY